MIEKQLKYFLENSLIHNDRLNEMDYSNFSIKTFKIEEITLFALSFYVKEVKKYLLFTQPIDFDSISNYLIEEISARYISKDYVDRYIVYISKDISRKKFMSKNSKKVGLVPLQRIESQVWRAFLNETNFDEYLFELTKFNINFDINFIKDKLLNSNKTEFSYSFDGDSSALKFINRYNEVKTLYDYISHDKSIMIRNGLGKKEFKHHLNGKYCLDSEIGKVPVVQISYVLEKNISDVSIFRDNEKMEEYSMYATVLSLLISNNELFDSRKSTDYSYA